MNNIEQYMKTLFGYTFKDDDYNFIKKEFDKKDKEIDRLNNIIDELEKFIKHRINFIELERKEFEEDFYNDIKTNQDEIHFRNMEIAHIEDILDKLKELKEGK